MRARLLAGAALLCLGAVCLARAQEAVIGSGVYGGAKKPLNCTPVNIGNNTNALATVTLTSVNVPAGSLVVVLAIENSVATWAGTIGDGTNTYSTVTNTAAQLRSAIAYSPNVTALSNATITYTKGTTQSGSLSAFYVPSGCIATTTPLDTAVTAQNYVSGAGNKASVTSGTPAQSGEFFLAFAAEAQSQAETYVQDAAHGWQGPPPSLQTVAPDYIGGGYQTNSGTGTIAYGGSQWSSPQNVNIAFVVGFKHP